MRGGTRGTIRLQASCHFNPPAPCGAGHPRLIIHETDSFISIHPPHAGRDMTEARPPHLQSDFNPPAPCGAGRELGQDRNESALFQSTRPMRGGTFFTAEQYWLIIFQSTRPMRGGTADDGCHPADTGISIHPPHAGRDPGSHLILLRRSISIHPPHAGRDRCDWFADCLRVISIHPPHAGRDPWLHVRAGHHPDFNPPAPCGAGLFAANSQSFGNIFQSTRPMRGGTDYLRRSRRRGGISIHPPHAGRDVKGQPVMHLHPPISIHPPHAGRDNVSINQIHQSTISIHPPHAGRDAYVCMLSTVRQISIHPPHAGRDILVYRFPILDSHFNPPAPCGAGQKVCDFFPL